MTNQNAYHFTWGQRISSLHCHNGVSSGYPVHILSNIYDQVLELVWNLVNYTLLCHVTLLWIKKPNKVTKKWETKLMTNNLWINNKYFVANFSPLHKRCHPEANTRGGYILMQQSNLACVFIVYLNKSVKLMWWIVTWQNSIWHCGVTGHNDKLWWWQKTLGPISVISWFWPNSYIYIYCAK